MKTIPLSFRYFALLGFGLIFLIQLYAFWNSSFYIYHLGNVKSLMVDREAVRGVEEKITTTGEVVLPALLVKGLFDKQARCMEKNGKANANNNKMELEVFGRLDVRDIAQRSCSFFALETKAMDEKLHAATFNRVGVRFPFFTTDAWRFYRCNALKDFCGRFLIEFVLDSKQREVFNGQIEEAAKTCHRAGTIVEYKQVLSKIKPNEPIEERLLSFFTQHEFGTVWARAIERAVVMGSVFGVKREFSLVRANVEWEQRLPSYLYSKVSGDVNSYQVNLPPLTTQLMYARNVYVDTMGRVVSLNAKNKIEVFYPNRGAYSHNELMETFTQKLNRTVEDNHVLNYHPDLHARKKFLSAIEKSFDLDACRNESARLLREGDFDSMVKCKDGAGIESFAVARMFVISQKLSNQMFHYLCESFPRIGSHLTWLSQDSMKDLFFLHASCLKHPGYCSTILGNVLGINKLVGVPKQTSKVYAGEAFVPEGGRRHWPLHQLWGFENIRKFVLHDRFGVEEEKQDKCFERHDRVKILIVKRSTTKLHPFHSHWYDSIGHLLTVDPAFKALTFNMTFEISYFDDTNKELMANGTKQIHLFRVPDVIIAAHGAGLSLLMFAKRCTHVISVRGRHNSDIYEHMAMGLGLPFHHVNFAYSFQQTYEDIQTSLGDAIVYEKHRMSWGGVSGRLSSTTTKPNGLIIIEIGDDLKDFLSFFMNLREMNAFLQYHIVIMRVGVREKDEEEAVRFIISMPNVNYMEVEDRSEINEQICLHDKILIFLGDRNFRMGKIVYIPFMEKRKRYFNFLEPAWFTNYLGETNGGRKHYMLFNDAAKQEYVTLVYVNDWNVLTHGEKPFCFFPTLIMRMNEDELEEKFKHEENLYIEVINKEARRAYYENEQNRLYVDVSAGTPITQNEMFRPPYLFEYLLKKTTPQQHVWWQKISKDYVGKYASNVTRSDTPSFVLLKLNGVWYQKTGLDYRNGGLMFERFPQAIIRDEVSTSSLFFTHVAVVADGVKLCSARNEKELSEMVGKETSASSSCLVEKNR